MLGEKFAVPLLITLLAMIPLAVWQPVSASDSNLVVLVSDNEADYALASSVVGLLGARLIVTPWGTYNATVSAEVLTAQPSRVIIIGGPVAVVSEYTQDLEDFGIPYERWYGADRYGTNLAVVGYLKEEFPGELGEVHDVAVVNGQDILAMQHYVRYYVRDHTGKKWLIVLTGQSHLNETLDVLGMLGFPENLTYIASVRGGSSSPMFPLNRKKMDVWFNVHFGGIPPISMDMISPENEGGAYQVLMEIQNRTLRAEHYLDGLRLPGARKKMEKAEEYLSLAWNAYDSGNTAGAYLLAVKAGFMADAVMLSVHRAMDTVFQGSPKIRLSAKLRWMKEIIEYLRDNGYDVEQLEALLSQAENALNAGQFERVLQELHQIKEQMTANVRRGNPAWHRGGRSRGRP